MPAPDATTDNYSITEDQLLVGSANGFLNNDSDPDGRAGLKKSERDDKWSFCLTAGTLCPANQEKQ